MTVPSNDSSQDKQQPFENRGLALASSVALASPGSESVGNGEDAPARGVLGARHAWLVATAIILVLTAYLMRGWLFGGGMPTSARREGLAELTMVWMAKEDLAHGQLFTEWNRYWFGGFPWLRYLSYPLYYGVAAVSAWGGVP